MEAEINQAVDPRIEKIDLLLELKRPEEARRLLMDCLAEQPEDPDVLHRLGNASRALGDDQAALEFYQQALAGFPEADGTLYSIGVTHFDNEDYEIAESYLLESLQYFQCPEACYILYRVYSEHLEREAEAVEYLKLGLELDPEGVSCRLGFLEADLEEAEASPSESLFRRTEALVANNPESVSCRVLLGRLWLRRDPERAEKIFLDLLSEDPEARWLHERVLRAATTRFSSRTPRLMRLYRSLVTWPTITIMALILLQTTASILSKYTLEGSGSWWLLIGVLSVSGLILWTALHPIKLYLMCMFSRYRRHLTDAEQKTAQKLVALHLSLIGFTYLTYFFLSVTDENSDMPGVFLAVLVFVAAILFDVDLHTEHWVFPELTRDERKRWNNLKSFT